MYLIPAKDVVPGAELDASLGMYPSRMFVPPDNFIETEATRTTFGFVVRGTVVIGFEGHHLQLTKGGYFAIPGAFRLEQLKDTLVVLIQRYGYRGLLTAGRIERKGRLSYIDGCSDTLLVPPHRLGDPCLNFLYFPPGICQTQHTHPSIRMGIVASGTGMAWQQKDVYGHGWEKPLECGNIFMLEEQEQHSFRTTDTVDGKPGSEMVIIAYHPDSDTGPTDVNHPMINRTLINHGNPMASPAPVTEGSNQ